jgi:hypothetical protein
MADDKRTSHRIASIAARGVRDPKSLTPDEVRSVAGSDLVQAAIRHLARTGDERTSQRVASIASRALRDPGGRTKEEIQTLCGSALTQAPSSAANTIIGNAMYVPPHNAMRDGN